MIDDLTSAETPLGLRDESSLEQPAKIRQTASLTVRQKILLAAVECSASDERFTTDALVLRAWKLFPESFSLGGTAHPDSNRVLAKLSGKDGLRALGWLELVGTSTYRVTRNGHREAVQLCAATALRDLVLVDASKPRAQKRRKSPSPELASVPTIDADILAVRSGERSVALRKFLRGSPLTFADACSFWGVTTQTSNAQQRIAHVGSLLERVTRLFNGDSAVAPRLPPLSTCYGLLNLHRLMLSRFARELAPFAAKGGSSP